MTSAQRPGTGPTEPTAGQSGAIAGHQGLGDVPVLDKAALLSADVAFMRSRAAMSERVRDAITAYLYAVANVRHGAYPGLAEVAEAVAWGRLARQRVHADQEGKP